ncbi:MAG: DUF2341 domain-containing protein, partial [Tsuneonella suprasediminis]
MGRLILTWLIALIALVATPAFAADSDGWWDQAWPYRRAVTVDTSPSGANVAGTIGRTMLLVRLHSGNFTFTDSMDNGADLRVVDSDGKTPLPFHIERFDAQNGLAAIWVSVPNLNGGEQHRIWLYYGNKNAPVGSDVAGTYDPDTVAAYHFGEAGGQPLKDLTANHNDGQNGAPGLVENGIIARAAKFAGPGAIIVPASPSLTFDAGAPFTVSGWIKLDQANGDQAAIGFGPLIVGVADGLPYALAGTQRLDANAPIEAGAWAKLA